MSAGPGISDAELAALLQQVQGDASGVVTAAVAALAPLKPEPICRVCLGELHERDTDLGTHVDCDPHEKERMRRLDPVPPPTLPDLTDALRVFDNGKERSMQKAIGPSEIGVPCDRRLGYALRNATKQPGELGWAPIMGTAIHAAIGGALTVANNELGRTRWLIEQRVQPDLEVFGSCDCYDCDTDTVIDWKLVGQSTIDKVRRHGPGDQYEKQAHIYGRGWQRAGRNPRFVRIVFLPRSSHRISDGFEWTAPYSREIAEAALVRLHTVAAELDALDVDNHPERWAEVAATPTSDACWFCPYHRKSGGPNPADWTGCNGYQSKAASAVDDYLATLPTASKR